MIKILVPTDFSNHSKAGICFAIQWATQQKAELVFIHILAIAKLTSWTDNFTRKLVTKELSLAQQKIEKFVSGIYKNLKVTPGKYTCVAKEGLHADLDVMEYCKKDPSIDFICISTRGAGKMKKILGTNTGNLITKSQVPVMVVPEKYITTVIKTVLYATDFKNLSSEMKQVIGFVKPLKAILEILHYNWMDEILFDKETIQKVLRSQYKYKFSLNVEKTDGTHSLVKNLQSKIRVTNPSVVIMFTNQGRNIIQKLFVASRSEELSFQTEVPLLVFKKR